MLILHGITLENVWRIVRLKVTKAQEDYVASNLESIAEAYATEKSGGIALPFGLYDGEEPVGFVMFGYGALDGENDPSVAKDSYCIWRFMIAQEHQRKGYGKQGMQAALDYLRSRPCGDAALCWLSVEPENEAAWKLYASFGFVENGEMCEGETVMVRPL